jgi:acetyl-CoA carboxylase biotin carboxyl carrier protein
MKIDEIKTIVELMSKHDLSEFNIEAEEMQLCIKRGNSSPITVNNAAMPVGMPAAIAAPVAPTAAPTAAAPVAESPTEAQESIDSPIVGTFYSAPSPELPVFVSVGDTVTPDTVVCIVEAMKVMNEIKAGKSGEIKKILLSDGTPVEFGQPLFEIV